MIFFIQPWTYVHNSSKRLCVKTLELFVSIVPCVIKVVSQETIFMALSRFFDLIKFQRGQSAWEVIELS